MKKLILSTFMLFGLAIGVSLACENPSFAIVNTSCGETGLASGCTTEELIEDAMRIEVEYCDPTIAP